MESTKRDVNLALQGGGAHGAFTWGVLETLLDEEDLNLRRISGTSAGALNGAALVSGYAANGRVGAKESLTKLWRRVAETGALMTLLHAPLKKPGLGVWDDGLPLLSPYQTNFVGLEPLRYILNSVIDVEALNSSRAPQLFVNAVNVNTGAATVFGPGSLSIDVLIASACAPFVFPAVQIGVEWFWDGSYGSNPMIWPLYGGLSDADIMLVELTPLHREELPLTAKNILNRINEIASISTLVSELREVAQVNRAAGEPSLRMHLISLPDTHSAVAVEPSTKRTIGPALFETLRAQGVQGCQAWISESKDSIGWRSTVDIEARYLNPYRRVVAGGTRVDDLMRKAP